MLSLVLFAGACHAEGEGLCKPLCEADKRECRAAAASLSRDDVAPLLAMEDRNPHAKVSRRMAGSPPEAQTTRASESKRVQMQRTCNDNHLRCVRACGNSPVDKPTQEGKDAPRRN
ncbi:hypothetical protein [Pseudoduganella namucuonensis]|uniref:Uncharacterized protein n=1 Tax=Pseudoduganella namucuonensis TaxID=1035707 RepID=A0A1I7LNG7_9BURK|nr:hypothetical protein [Pseudoduganella namucuonensis]SFV11237.1 hypothetical protein SAMN05216552_103368 [Pseudoduganella namucuonensis]